MSKVIILKGLPASGKTTLAREMQKTNPNLKRINKDDLRAMLDDGVYSKENESHINSVRDVIILRSLDRGFDVIVDDTNFGSHEAHIRDSFENLAEFETIFVDTSRDECLLRNVERGLPVPQDAIQSMYNKYLVSDCGEPGEQA